MKPWLLKFLFVSGSAILVMIGLGLYVNRSELNSSGLQASILDITTSSQETQNQDSDSLDADQSESIESSEDDQSSENFSEPGQSAVVTEPVVITVPAPVASVANIQTPAYISIPSNGFGGGSVSQPPVTIVTPSAQLEISVMPASSTPEAASSTPPIASSTPEISFICTPDPETSSTTSHVVISELFIDMVGADTQEFIKLYNPTDQDFSLASSSLQYLSASASGIDKVSKKNFSASSTIAAHAYYLVGTGEYAGPTADMLWSQALSNTGASVLLISNTDLITGIDDSDIIDRVAYGSGTIFLANDPPLSLPTVGDTLKL